MKIANVALGNVGCKPNWSRLCDWLKRRNPDIVTLQKIGSSEPFPKDRLCEFGYESWPLDHSRNDLGVAILGQRNFLSRRDVSPPKMRHCELPCDDLNESRFLTVSIGNLWVSSVYAPYGPKRLGERAAIEKRVAWLNRLRDHINKEGYAHRDSLLCGDFNVMADGPPWKPGYSENEWRVLDELLRLGFFDLYRCAYSDPIDMLGCTRGYDLNPKGTNRLHLVLASGSLKRRLRSAYVDVDSEPRPRSDAPPLVVELEDVRV